MFKKKKQAQLSGLFDFVSLLGGKGVGSIKSGAWAGCILDWYWHFLSQPRGRGYPDRGGAPGIGLYQTDRTGRTVNAGPGQLGLQPTSRCPKSFLALALEGLCVLSESPTAGGKVTFGNAKQGEHPPPLAGPNLRVAPSA